MRPALPLEQRVHRRRPALGVLPGGLVERDADVLADFDAGIAAQRQFLVVAERGRPQPGEIHLLPERGAAQKERASAATMRCVRAVIRLPGRAGLYHLHGRTPVGSAIDRHRRPPMFHPGSCVTRTWPLPVE